MERWEKASPSRWHLSGKNIPGQGTCVSRGMGVWEVLLKGSVGLAWHMGSRAAGERRRWQGTLAGLDGGRLGQAKRPRAPQWSDGPLRAGGKKAGDQAPQPLSFWFLLNLGPVLIPEVGVIQGLLECLFLGSPAPRVLNNSAFLPALPSFLMGS